MRILVVEDDSFKRNAIAKLLTAGVGRDLTAVASLRSAIVELESTIFDFVVLDMAIPSHTSDMGAIDTYSQPVGGLDVLLFLTSNTRPERVAVLTQYPTVEYDRRHVPLNQLVDVLRADGVDSVVDVIRFGEGEFWEERLLSAIGVKS